MIELLLPCPLSAGWELLWQQNLPRQAGALPLGGFSGMELDWPGRRLWLLSDAPRTHSLELSWRGGVRQPQFLLKAPQHLTDQGNSRLDGEALVRAGQGGRFWMASEGRTGLKSKAALLELAPTELGGFRVLRRSALPEAWQPAEGFGMRSNRGPEALVALTPDRLLLAPESELQQDQGGQLRLLLARLQGPDLIFSPLGARLQVASPSGYEAHWGLTALVPAELTKRSKKHTPLLLALWRGYAEPDSWWNRLSLLPRIPLEAKAGAPLSPLMSWNLKRIGLEPDNWEAMEGGPLLEDGRPTLLMASDNNFNPLQQNRLALLAPRRSGRCESWPP